VISGEAFVLEFPAEAQHVGTARSFASALVRQLGGADEMVEDVKLAVSEACTDTVVSLGGRGAMQVRGYPGSVGLRLEIDAPGRFEELQGDGPGSAVSSAARLELIRSLFPDADLAEGADGPILRFTVPLG
jgi:hypothetical protein